MPEQMISKHAFKGSGPTELSFKKGEIINVLKMDPSGWAQGELNGVKGWFPFEFVMKIVKEEPPANPDEPPRREAPKAENPVGDATTTAQEPQVQQKTVEKPKPKPLPAPKPNQSPPIAPPKLDRKPSEFISHAEYLNNASASKESIKSNDSEGNSKEDSSSKFDETKPDKKEEEPSKLLLPTGSVGRKTQIPKLPSYTTLARNTERTDDLLTMFVGSTARKKTLLRRRMLDEEASQPAEEDEDDDEEDRAVEMNSTPATVESVLKEFQKQFEALLYKKKCINDGIPHALLDKSLVSQQYFERSKQLNPTEVERCFHILRTYFMLHSREKLPEMCELIMTFGQRFGMTRKTTHAPRSSDLEKEMPDETKDETVMFDVVDLLYNIINTNSDAWNSSSNESLFGKLSDFLFDKLNYIYSPAVRNRAGECIGYLSHYKFEKIVMIYTVKLLACKTDDEQREFVFYQRAMKYLAFGLNKPYDEVTIQFLGNLAGAMDKLTRGVLKQEICSVLTTVFVNILNPENPVAKVDIERIDSRFWNHYSSIYNIAKKWSKKNKLRTPCYKLMSTMVSNSNLAFMTDKANDLLSQLIAALKEAKVKKPILDCIFVYVKAYTVERLKDDRISRIFAEHTDKLIPVLLSSQKKTPNTPPELVVIKDIVYEMGRRKLDTMEHKHLQLLMRSNSGEYSPEQKGIVLRVLVALDNEFGPELRRNDTLKLMIDPIYDLYDGTLSPLLPIISCFPGICYAQRLREIAKKITGFIWNTNTEITTAAVSSLQNFIKMSPDENLIIIMSHMLDFMEQTISQPSDQVLFALKNFCFILDFYEDFMDKNNMTPKIEKSLWSKMRETMETLSFLYLLHNEPQVWTKTLVLLSLLKKPILKDIERTEGSSQQLLFLGDFFNLYQAIDLSSWFPGLTEFIEKNGEQFVGILQSAWMRVYRDWRPNTPLWRNYTKFLMLTFHIVAKHTKDPKVDVFVDQLISFLFAPSPTDEAQTIIDIISEVPPGPLESFAKALETEREKRWKDKKKKKDHTYFIQENILAFYARLVPKIMNANYDEAEYLVKAVRELVFFCISNSKFIAGLNNIIKTNIMEIAQKWITLEGCTVSPDSDENQRLTNEKFVSDLFQFLYDIIFGDAKGISKNSQLEQRVLEAITGLIIYGKADDDVNKRILGFLSTMRKVGPYLESVIDQAMSTFLNKNPKYLDEFINKSLLYGEEDSISCLRALEQNFTADFARWNKLCPPSKMLYLSLYHQCSSTPIFRGLAVDIANGLAKNGVLDPGFSLPQTSKVSAHLYLELAYEFSTAMAQKYPDLSAPLLKEVVYFIGPLSNEEKREYKQFMLKLMLPWVKNFGFFLKKGDVDTYHSIIDSIYILTEQCFTVELQHYLEPLWTATVTANTNEEAFGQVLEVVAYLIGKFQTVSNDDPSKGTKEVSQVCRVAFDYITRGNSDLVIKCLVGKLRQYGTSPTTPEEFIRFYLPKDKLASLSYDINEERSCFNLFVDLAYENGLKLKPYLPILLQNAFVTYGPSRVRKYPECLHFLINLLQSAGFRHGLTTESRDASIKLTNNLQGRHTNVYGEYKQVEFQAEDILEIVRILSQHEPSLRSQWADLALEWALQAYDFTEPTLSLSSYKLFTILNNTFDYNMLSRLVMFLFKTMIHAETEKTTMILQTFAKLPAEVALDQKSKELVSSLGNILLQSSSISTLHTGVTMLQLCMKTKEEVEQFWSTPSEVIKVLFKGLTSPVTCLQSLWFFGMFASSHPEDSHLSITILLVYAIFAFLEEDSAKEAPKVLETLGEKVAPFKEIFNKKFNSASTGDGGKLAFVEGFFGTLVKQYPTEDDFAYTLDAIMIFLRRGVERWKFPLFTFLTSLLSHYQGPFSSDELVQLAELIVYYCHSSSERVANAAEEFLPFVVNNLHLSSIPLKLFTFLRKAPPNMNSTKNKDRFLGDTKGDYKENLLEQVKNIYIKIFQLKTDSETAKALEAKFISCNSIKRSNPASKQDVRKSRSGSLLPFAGQTLTRLLAEEENAVSVQPTPKIVEPESKVEEPPEIKTAKPQDSDSEDEDDEPQKPVPIPEEQSSQPSKPTPPAKPKPTPPPKPK